MADLLLVHGSCMGAWVWQAVLPALAALGHRACAIDLPGRDGRPCTLADHAATIHAALTGPTVLVGHSAGGFAIEAAAGDPRVSGLIHIAAYVPQPGRSLADLRRAGPAQPMRGTFEVSPDRTSYRFRPDRCADLFFHDCPDAAALTARMGAEPLAPQETAFPPGPLPALPRAAIICTDDRAIPPDWQRAMAAGLPQIDLPSGHCPFLSMPDRLAQTLHGLLGGMENATNPVAG